MQLLSRFGNQCIQVVSGIGSFSIFLLRLIAGSSELWRKPIQAVRALFSAGVLSLPIILVAGFFVGMVLAFQGYTIFVRFGAEESLSLMVSLSLMRELGAVVSALLFAGRAGSAFTAEISLMKTTEQLAAMEMMGIDPVRQVGVPRFWGALLAMPLLAMLFVAVAICGAYVVGVINLGVDAGIFWSQMQNGVNLYNDLIEGLVIKSFIFGVVISAIAVYQGFASSPTVRGMGVATTKTVVLGSLAVLGLDFILTAFMFGG